MQELVKLLKEKQLTIGSIESMTGGLFASTITSIPGVSVVYKGSVISYAIEEKINVVGVRKKTIDKYGVVSKEVALEMAKYGAKTLNVDVCISITGNAGPTVEPDGKPVGEIHLGLCIKGKLFHKQLSLKGDRNHIRSMCVEEMKSFVLTSLNSEAL